MKIVAIRADASGKIGTGHVMRCLVLAEQIRREINDVKIIFLCVREDGNLISHIQGLGYQVVELARYDDVETARQLAIRISTASSESISRPIDLLIVDHYRLDVVWEQTMRELARTILIIDDLANRVHDCDALLDQNLNQQMAERYLTLVPESCRCFIGPRHLLLRPEFLLVREQMKNRIVELRDSSLQLSVRNILIFYGGSDPTRETMKALQAVTLWLDRLRDYAGELNVCEVRVNVISGTSNPMFTEIEEQCNTMKNIQLFRHVDNMAEILLDTDIVLGAGGVAMWERCYLGVPSIVTIVAENQRSTTEYAALQGAIWNAGWHADVTAHDLAVLLERADQDFHRRKRMSERAVVMMKEGIGEKRLLDWILETLC